MFRATCNCLPIKNIEHYPLSAQQFSEIKLNTSKGIEEVYSRRPLQGPNTHGALPESLVDLQVEARPQVEVAHEQVPHDALHLTEAGRERQRRAGERLDEARLKNKAGFQLIHLKACCKGLTWAKNVKLEQS